MKLLERTIFGLVLALATMATSAAAETAADTSLDNEVENYLAENSGKWGEPDTFRAYWKSGLKFESGDGNFKMAIGGRLMFDMDFRDGEDGYAASEYSANNTFFRRIRLAVSGTIYKNTIFKVQLDFAKAAVALKDVFVGLKNLGGGSFLAGHQKVPFGLDELTSSKYISFLERAAASNVFAPSRDVGFVWGRNFLESKRLWFRIGMFQITNDQGQQTGNGGWGVAFRITGLAIENTDKDMILHIGFAFRWQNLRAEGQSIRYRARPNTGTGARVIDTGSIDAQDELRYGFEIAFRMKSVHFQGEFFSATPNTTAGGDDPTFTGWYIQVGWFITGEARKWEQTKNGVWGRTKPKANFWTGEGGKGGLEVTFRYDQTDLSDSGFVGGEMADFTVGFNWYWNPNARVMFNYIYADITDGSAGDGSMSIFSIRWQLDF